MLIVLVVVWVHQLGRVQQRQDRNKIKPVSLQQWPRYYNNQNADLTVPVHISNSPPAFTQFPEDALGRENSKESRLSISHPRLQVCISPAPSCSSLSPRTSSCTTMVFDHERESGVNSPELDLEQLATTTKSFPNDKQPCATSTSSMQGDRVSIKDAACELETVDKLSCNVSMGMDVSTSAWAKMRRKILKSSNTTTTKSTVYETKKYVSRSSNSQQERSIAQAYIEAIDDNQVSHHVNSTPGQANTPSLPTPKTDLYERMRRFSRTVAETALGRENSKKSRLSFSHPNLQVCTSPAPSCSSLTPMVFDYERECGVNTPELDLEQLATTTISFPNDKQPCATSSSSMQGDRVSIKDAACELETVNNTPSFPTPQTDLHDITRRFSRTAAEDGNTRQELPKDNQDSLCSQIGMVKAEQVPVATAGPVQPMGRRYSAPCTPRTLREVGAVVSTHKFCQPAAAYSAGTSRTVLSGSVLT